MASPQKENGFTSLSNELLEAFIIYKFTEYERVIVLHIWRKTYGFSKKEDWIANSQFVEATGINKGNVSRTITALKKKNVVISINNHLSINKDWESWKVISRDNNSYLYRLQKLSPEQPQKKKEKINITTDKKMHTYTPIDESGNPLQRKSKTKINQTENRELIDIGTLWQTLCSKLLQIPKEEVIMQRIYFPIRSTYDREKFTKEQFKELFEYFFKDRDIKQESKLSFDLCLSQKYVAKWKMKNKQKVVTNVSMSDQTKL